MVSLEEYPLSKTWAEIEKAVDMGLVKFIGVSNFSVKKVKEILERARWNVIHTCNKKNS